MRNANIESQIKSFKIEKFVVIEVPTITKVTKATNDFNYTVIKESFINTFTTKLKLNGQKILISIILLT